MPETTQETELDRRFVAAVRKLPCSAGRVRAGPDRAAADRAAPVRAGTRLTGEQAVALFDAQAGSRHLDLAARYLRSEGHGYYTIGSAGHEADAAVAAVLRPTDPALLHYRSGAFYLARAAQVPGSQALRDVLLGLTGASDEPIAGGRHKVFGHHGLAVIPQTSTIASHLPRAVGIAFSIGRAEAGPGLAVARRRDRGGQFRGRLGQSLHGDRRHQRRLPHGLPGPANAAAAGLRGQRPGHQRAHPGRLGGRGPFRAARAALLQR